MTYHPVIHHYCQQLKASPSVAVSLVQKALECPTYGNIDNIIWETMVFTLNSFFKTSFTDDCFYNCAVKGSFSSDPYLRSHLEMIISDKIDPLNLEEWL